MGAGTGRFLWLVAGSPEDGHKRRHADVPLGSQLRDKMMSVMETACSEVPLHPTPQRAHLQDSELPAFVRPAGRSREKVRSDWPHVPASGPCTDPWGLGKCAWNKPPGPWWSWSTSPSPTTLAFLPQAHTLGSGYFWGGREGWLWDTSVPLQLFLSSGRLSASCGKVSAGKPPQSTWLWGGQLRDGGADWCPLLLFSL